jgi:chromosome segregation ATPase
MFNKSFWQILGVLLLALELNACGSSTSNTPQNSSLSQDAGLADSEKAQVLAAKKAAAEKSAKAKKEEEEENAKTAKEKKTSALAEVRRVMQLNKDEMLRLRQDLQRYQANQQATKLAIRTAEDEAAQTIPQVVPVNGSADYYAQQQANRAAANKKAALVAQANKLRQDLAQDLQTIANTEAKIEMIAEVITKLNILLSDIDTGRIIVDENFSMIEFLPKE